ERYAESAVEALSGVPASKRRLWLIPALFALSAAAVLAAVFVAVSTRNSRKATLQLRAEIARLNSGLQPQGDLLRRAEQARGSIETDRKSTRLNSSHQIISYAVFCLKKKRKSTTTTKHQTSDHSAR